jgi:hypothetical protein
MDDEARYRLLQEKQAVDWEARCTRCGACCGVFERDPCENLEKSSDGKYSCRIYTTRFGLRKSISGRIFECVPLRQILHTSWPGKHQCGYKNIKQEN